jgi:hypothetical protein
MLGGNVTRVPENKKRKKNKMRKEGGVRLWSQKNTCMFREPADHHSSLSLSRTVEAVARLEIHGLHAFGEQELVDGTCEREGKQRGRKSEE